MLQSKFAKKGSSFKAQKFFTDRMAPRHVLSDSLQNIETKPLEIIAYYGKGGIGKTRLLKELVTVTNTCTTDDTTFIPIFISLDAYDYSNPINILTSIRNSIKGNCALFDYAMTLYCAKTKMSIDDIKNKRWNLSHNVLEHVNDVLALVTLNAAIPLKWIGSAIDAIQDLRFRTAYQDEILELSQLNEFEIFERLPYYLGICIQQASHNGFVHVIFLDSYESLLARTYGHTPSAECDDWVRELVLASEKVRLVVASRDKLKWEQVDAEWGSVLNQHRLNNLSDDDARWFLKNAPIKDDNIVEFIVKNSKGVPLYLDMCIDVYESLYNTYQSSLTIDIFEKEGNFYNTRGKVMIDRYLRHLSEKQHNAVKVLSVMHTFSRAFAMEMLQKANLPHYNDEMTVLLEKSIFLSVDNKNDIWKLDESIRTHLWTCLSVQEKRELIQFIVEITNLDSNGQYFMYFANAMEIILRENGLIVPVWQLLPQQIEKYANGGFWNELHGLLSQHINNCNIYIHTLAVISEIICLRRYGKLREAAKLIDTYQIDTQLLGSFIYQYRFLCVHIRHLLGQYDEALHGYASLLEEMSLVRATLPSHIYTLTALKYADILFLKGRFNEALQQVDEILEKPIDDADKLEALRIKGHIYRFNKQYTKARVIYSSAMNLVQGSSMPAYIGKLLTNHMEVNCFDQPQKTLELFERAIEANRDNNIELGKCYAAASIAQTETGNTDLAMKYAHHSRELAKSSGYQSGELFALAAQHHALLVIGDNYAATKIREQAVELFDKIKVYQFIIDSMPTTND